MDEFQRGSNVAQVKLHLLGPVLHITELLKERKDIKTKANATKEGRRNLESIGEVVHERGPLLRLLH